eukprot:960655-Amphidinium_carterae.1
MSRPTEQCSPRSLERLRIGWRMPPTASWFSTDRRVGRVKVAAFNGEGCETTGAHVHASSSRVGE